MKKISSFIIMLLVVFLFSYIASAEAYTYDEAYSMLKSIGVAYDDDELSNAGAKITRAQFVRYAVRLSAVSVTENIDDASFPFADVSKSHPDYEYIHTAVKLGFVNGDNGFFLPDEPISYYAASKIAVHILGYELLSQAQGGYPAGYLKYCASLGLFEGCTVSDTMALTSEDVSLLLYNILHADVLETSVVGDEGNDYQPVNNLLSRRHKVYTHEGIITKNAYTSLVASDGIGVSGAVVIDGVEYTSKNIFDSYSYIGMSVKVYYKKTQGSKREIIHTSLTEDNNIVKLNGKDVINPTNTSVSYYENDRQKTLSLSRSASLILNGSLYSLTKSNASVVLKPETGTVTLIDNNSDKIYDVITVENYRAVLVGGISKKSFTVSDILGGESLILDETDTDYDLCIEKDGKKASFDDIAEDTVISYYESDSEYRKLKKLIISDKYIKGTVEEVNTCENTYLINNEFYKALSKASSFLDVGVSGKYFLDFMGNIVYCHTDETDIVYGYLTGIEKTNSMGSFEAKIFTENNRWVILPLPDKLRFNGNTKTDDEVYTLLGGDNIKKQLITYLVSDDRKLVRLNTASSFAKNSEDEKTAIEKQIFRLSDTYASINYRADGPSFDDKCYISDSIIFSVPDDSAPDYSDDKFEILSISDFTNSGVYSNIKAYDMDEYGFARAIVVPYIKKAASSTDAVMIVDRLTSSVNKEGNVVTAIRGFYYGIEARVNLSENIASEHMDIVNTLKKGDVIRISIDKKGYVNAVSTKLIDFKTEGSTPKKIVGGSYDIGTFISGEVKAVNAQKGVISIDCGYSGGANAVHRLSSLKNVYEYSIATQQMTSSDISAIAAGDNVYMTSRYLRANLLIIIRP